MQISGRHTSSRRERLVHSDADCSASESDADRVSHRSLLPISAAKPSDSAWRGMGGAVTSSTVARETLDARVLASNHRALAGG